MSDPMESVTEIIFGRWRSQILYTGVKLGIFDAVSEEERSSDEIANELNLDSNLCYRLLRSLGSLELLKEKHNRMFSISLMGTFLQKKHPQTLRGMTLLEEGPEHYALWKHLPDIVQDGKQNAFIREYGRMAFEHAAQDAR